MLANTHTHTLIHTHAGYEVNTREGSALALGGGSITTETVVRGTKE